MYWRLMFTNLSLLSHSMRNTVQWWNCQFLTVTRWCLRTWRPCIARPAHSFDWKLTNAQYLSGNTRMLCRLPNLHSTQTTNSLYSFCRNNRPFLLNRTLMKVILLRPHTLVPFKQSGKFERQLLTGSCLRILDWTLHSENPTDAEIHCLQWLTHSI